MGIRPAPSYANIFMAKIDKLAEGLATKFGDGVHPVRFWKRFLDDIFLIWTGSLDKLHQFLDALNTMHPTIKFTINHTKSENDVSCECNPCTSIPFLDTSASVEFEFVHIFFKLKTLTLVTVHKLLCA